MKPGDRVVISSVNAVNPMTPTSDFEVGDLVSVPIMTYRWALRWLPFRLRHYIRNIAERFGVDSICTESRYFRITGKSDPGTFELGAP